MTEPQIPSDEELNRLYAAEVSRAIGAVADAIMLKLDEAQIGRDLPPRVSAAVVLHALTLIGMQIGAQRNLTLEDIQEVVGAAERFMISDRSPLPLTRRS